MKKKVVALHIIILFIILLVGCSSKNTNESTDGKIVIYTTVYPLKDFSEKIGGDYVSVESIYPPGVDEHSFEPSQKDIMNMANGNLFFYIGYHLEGFMNTAKPILKDQGVKVIPIGEQVQLEKPTEHVEDEEEGHHHGDIDPHIWLDPIYAKQMASSIAEALSEEMPEQKAYFEENLLNLEKQLDDLNEQFIKISDNSSVKEFVVSHAAYGYWEKRYGLKQLNISGISTAQEPSQKQLIKIIDEIEKNDIQYILVEQNVSSNLVDVIQGETKASTLPVHNLSVLTENDIKNGDDYFSLMKNNLKTLKKALNP